MAQNIFSCLRICKFFTKASWVIHPAAWGRTGLSAADVIVILSHDKQGKKGVIKVAGSALSGSDGFHLFHPCEDARSFTTIKHMETGVLD